MTISSAEVFVEGKNLGGSGSDKYHINPRREANVPKKQLSGLIWGVRDREQTSVRFADIEIDVWNCRAIDNEFYESSTYGTLAWGKRGDPLSVAEFRYLDALFCRTGFLKDSKGALFSMTGCLFAALLKALSAGLMARTEVAQSRALRQEDENFIVPMRVT